MFVMRGTSATLCCTRRASHQVDRRTSPPTDFSVRHPTPYDPVAPRRRAAWCLFSGDLLDPGIRAARKVRCVSSSDWSPFLNLVRPDIAAAFRGEVHAIVVVAFFLLIIGFTVWTLVYVLRAHHAAIRVVAQLQSLTGDLTAENIAAVRNEARRRARDLGSAGELWREFDETLVASADGKVWNTVEAEHYFSGDRIAPRLVANRLLSTMPAVLTALGLLGTFIGLAVGLDGLNLTETADADEMRDSVGSLVTGVSLGFTASVWGVFTSVLVNATEKWCSRDVSRRVATFRGRIDEIFVQRTPEHSLVLIEQYTQDSATALAELHEKIGTKLQEAVTGLSEEMQSALTRAIETAVAPSMNALAERTSNQSAQVFEDLVDKFTESFRGIGERQAAELGSASATLDSALTGVSDRVGAAVASMQEAAAAQAAATAAQTAAQERQIAEQEESFRSQMSERTQAFEAEMSTLTELVTSQAKILDGSLSALAVGM